MHFRERCPSFLLSSKCEINSNIYRCKKGDILQVVFKFLPAVTKEKKENAAIRNVVPIPIMAAIFDDQMTDNTLRKRCEREFIITSLFEGLN